VRRKLDCKNQCANAADANLKLHVRMCGCGWETTRLPVDHRGFVQGRTSLHIFKLKRFFNFISRVIFGSVANIQECSPQLS